MSFIPQLRLQLSYQIQLKQLIRIQHRILYSLDKFRIIKRIMFLEQTFKNRIETNLSSLIYFFMVTYYIHYALLYLQMNLGITIIYYYNHMLKLAANCFRKEMVKLKLPDFLPITKTMRMPFCSQPTQSHQKQAYPLQDYEWEALENYYLYEFIQQLQTSNNLKNFQSIRESIIQKERFNKYVLEKINTKTGKQYNSLEEIGFKKNRIETLLKAFHLTNGIYVPKTIYIQDRYNDGRNITLRTTLNPLLHSISIMNHLTTMQSKGIIYGQKGIGKSFTFVLYSYLVDSIVRCRIKRYFTNNNSQKLFELMPPEKFYQMPYLIYFPIKLILQNRIKEAKLSLVNQAPPLMNIQRYKMEKVTSLTQLIDFTSRYLAQIKSFFQPIISPIEKQFETDFENKQEKNESLQLVVLIDEANQYFRQVRLLDQSIISYQEKVKWQKKSSAFNPKTCQDLKIRTDFEKIEYCSDFLYQVYSNSRIVFNSSQKIEQRIITNFNRTYQHNIFNIKSHEKADAGDLQIKYTQFIMTEIGKRELYAVFWFEIEKELIFSMEQNKGRNQQIQMLREIFCHTFQLGENQQSLGWANDVKQLQIRTVVQTYYSSSNWKSKFSEVNAYLNSCDLTLQQRKEQNKKYFTDIFLQIKDRIEQTRSVDLKQIFQFYIQKSVPKTQRGLRYQILYYLEMKLKQKIMEQKQLQNKQKLIKQNSNVQYLQQQRSQQNILTFSYRQLLNKYKRKSIQKLSIQNFPYQAGLGTSNFDKKQLSFILKIDQMKQMLRFINLYTKQLGDYYRIIAYNGIHPAFAGQLLDKIFFFLFCKNSFTLNFNTKRKGQNGALIESIEKYQVVKTVPLTPIQHFNTHFRIGILNEIIKQAKSEPGKTILGYNGSKIKEQNQGNNYFYRSQNAKYDFVLVTYDSDLRRTKVNLVDTTIKKDLKDKFPNFNQLKNKLQQYSTEQNIKLQFSILSPAYKVYNYENNPQNNPIPYTSQIFLKPNNKSYEFYICTFNEQEPSNHFKLKENNEEEKSINKSLFCTIQALKAHEGYMANLPQNKQTMLQNQKNKK